MNIMDILGPYAERPTDTVQDFDEVAAQLPADELGAGITEAFRSDRTPDFGSMAASLFGASDGPQRAGLLGQLIAAVGPALLSTLAGGALGRYAQTGGREPAFGAAGVEGATDLTASQVREIAQAAEQKDPSILDRVGSFYARHPGVVKTLGGAALAIALGKIAGMRR